LTLLQKIGKACARCPEVSSARLQTRRQPSSQSVQRLLCAVLFQFSKSFQFSFSISIYIISVTVFLSTQLTI